MITGDINAIKRMAMSKLCRAEDPIQFMGKVCELFSELDTQPDGYDSEGFKAGTKAILEDAFTDIDTISELRAYLWMVHNAYITAATLAEIRK